MPKLWSKSLFITTLLLLVTTLQGQSNFSNLEPFYLNYTTDDGLPSSECHQTIQDQRGYIWIATDNGVSRFDGYGFRNFSADDGLKNNVVFYLQEDKKGRIWMLTMSGNLYYYDYETDRVHGYEFNEKIRAMQGQFDWAGPFYVDAQNTVYIGLKNLGVIRIGEQGNSSLFQTEEVGAYIVLEVEDFLVYATIDCPFEQMDQCNELYRFKNKTAPIEFYRDTTFVKKVYCSISKSEVSKTGFLKKKGANIFFKKLKSNQYFVQLWHAAYLIDANLADSPKEGNIRVANAKSIIEFSNGTMLLGELNPGGIYELKDDSDFFDSHTKFKILSNKNVSSILCDKQNGLWITTTQHGIFHLPNYQDNVINKKIGLSSDNINCFTFKNRRELLVGIGKDELFEIDLDKNKLRKFPRFESEGMVKKIYFNPDNQAIWVASGRFNWFENKKWNLIKRVHEDKLHVIHDFGRSFNLTNDNDFFWSWGFSFFSKINREEKKVVYYSSTHGIREVFTNAYEDFEQRVWVGNLRGLFEFKDSELIPQTAHAAFQTRVEAIQQLQDSTLVIGTKGAGIVLWKGKNISHITKGNGLTSNMIENVYIDALQRIWVGTSAGLNMIRLNKNETPFVKQYTRKHGLPSNEINQVEAYGSEVWVATTKGLIKLPEWSVDTVSHRPIIEKIIVNGQPINDFNHRKVALKYHQNALQIEFLTLDLKQHGDIPYRYRLLPGQQDWMYSKNRRLDFSALRHNDYLLEIQSQNRDGYWSESAVFAFKINAPYWLTWWFLVGSALLIISGIFIWMKRVQREANLTKKMAEAEQFALRAQMNPHFIFNCLASIQGFVSTGEKDKAIRYLARFSKLIRTSLSFMDKEKITLEEEVAMITNYLELEKMRHGEMFDYSLEIAADLDMDDTEIPPLMVQPFVENSILHAFVDKKVGGFLKIKYEVKNGHFLATVEDNGIGLTESALRKKNAPKNHESIGTKIIARRLELKKDTLGSRLTMEEIKNEQREVQGTKVVIDFGKLNL